MRSLDAVGQSIFESKYALAKGDEPETVEEVVERVARGNVDWVPWVNQDAREREIAVLKAAMLDGAMMPGGRHLRNTGLEAKSTSVFNCFATGWSKGWARGHGFLFERLLEHGGVGTNYSFDRLPGDSVDSPIIIHFTCDPSHGDYEHMMAEGLLSDITESMFDDPGYDTYCVDDSREGWVQFIEDLINMHFDTESDKWGLIVDISQVRPSGAPISGGQGTASGPELLAVAGKKICDVYYNAYFKNDGIVTPLDAMEIDHALSRCVQAGGVRRGARMAMMHWSDSYIEEFLACKQEFDEQGSLNHWTTNISVIIDDDFVNWLFDGYAPVVDIFDRICEGMAHNGEPGIWNIDESNKAGDRAYLTVTNPCGEIPLPEFGNCNLGHVNLEHVIKDGYDVEDHYSPVKLMTRFLIRATEAPLSRESGEVLKRDRRIGVGLLNIVKAAAMHGHDARKSSTYDFLRPYLRKMREAVDAECKRYSAELGLPEPVKQRTIAPTGTVSFLLTGSTSGAQPPFARKFIRNVRYSTAMPAHVAELDKAIADGLEVVDDPLNSDGKIVRYLVEHAGSVAVRVAGYDPATVFATQYEWSLDEHIAWVDFLTHEWCDNAMSYTATLPPGTTGDDIKKSLQPYIGRIKGFTGLPEVHGFAYPPIEPLTDEEFKEYATKVNHSASVDSDVDDKCLGGACPI